MKCAVLSAPGQIEITERTLADCGPFDVLVAVETCGVCRTDRKAALLGQRDLVLPRILGHEIVGHIQQVGSAIASFQVGDYVQVYPGNACATCAACLDGNDHLCDQMQIIGFHLDGGFAEYILICGQDREPENLNILPARLDSKTASLAEPLACSINLLQRLSLDSSTSLVIFGAGPLGILTAQLAALYQVKRIAMVEPHAGRRRIAADFSDAQFDFNSQTTADLMQFSQGHGFDIAIPCCPGNEPFEMSLEVLARRGQLGFFSGLTGRSDISNSYWNNIHYRELSVVGSYGCSLAHNREALKLLSAGQISLAGLPCRDISWLELPVVLSNLDPFEHVFTFFHP